MSTSAANLTEEERRKAFIQTEGAKILKDTTAFIEETNLQSMIGLKDTILAAIKALETPNPDTSKLYQSTSDNGSSVFCYVKDDVLNAIERGFEKYVAAYKEVTSSETTIEENKKINTQLAIIEEGMDVAGLSEVEINKEVKELQEDTKKAWLAATAEARAQLLPPSEPTSTVPSGVATRRGSLSVNYPNASKFATVGTNGTVTLPRGGMYRPKKHKKSRKHPK